MTATQLPDFIGTPRDQCPNQVVNVALHVCAHCGKFPLACLCSHDSPHDCKVIDEYGAIFVRTGNRTALNHFGVAAMFATRHQTFFDEGSGGFIRYNPKNGCFEPISHSKLKREIARFLAFLAQRYHLPELITRRTNALLNNLVQMLRLQERESRADLPTTGVIHVGNGMLNLNGGDPSLLPFSPRYCSRRACSINYSAGGRCDRFLKELLEPALQEDDISLLQRYCGSVLLGPNQAQRILIIHGNGAAGKSTFVNILENLVGANNVADLRTQHLGGRFETHAFLNKILLGAKDVNSDFLRSKGAKMLKSLVGGDELEAELKHGGKFKLHGTFQAIITSNSRLQIDCDGDEDAWRRRVMVVKFDREKPEKYIPDFANLLLQTEGEGILAWMVAGACAHLKELSETGGFCLSQSQSERIDAFLLGAEGGAAEVLTQSPAPIGKRYQPRILTEGLESRRRTEGAIHINVKHQRSGSESTEFHLSIPCTSSGENLYSNSRLTTGERGH